MPVDQSTRYAWEIPGHDLLYTSRLAEGPDGPGNNFAKLQRPAMVNAAMPNGYVCRIEFATSLLYWTTRLRPAEPFAI